MEKETSEPPEESEKDKNKAKGADNKLEESIKNILNSEPVRQYVKRTTVEGDNAEMQIRSLAPVLLYFSASRQEKIVKRQEKNIRSQTVLMQGMEDQSNKMLRHSKAMLTLTWVIIILTGLLVLEKIFTWFQISFLCL